MENRNQTFPIVRYLSWKLELLSDILWVIVGVMGKGSEVLCSCKHDSAEYNLYKKQNVMFLHECLTLQKRRQIIIWLGEIKEGLWKT